MVYLWFVSIESFGAEALVPDSAAMIMRGFVAGGYDGDAGEEEVIEGGFDAPAAGSVDLSHC